MQNAARNAKKEIDISFIFSRCGTVKKVRTMDDHTNFLAK